MADGTVRPDPIVVSEPILHLFGSICKRQEPMRVQALAAEPAIESLYKGVVRRLAGPEKPNVTPLA